MTLRLLLIIFILSPLLSLSQIGGKNFTIPVGTNGGSGGSYVSHTTLNDSMAAIRGDLPTSFPVNIGPQEAVNVVDSGKYITSTVICQDEEWVYMFYNLAVSHTATGKLYMQKSKNGTYWTTPVQPVIGGSVVDNVGLISCGIGNNGRIVLRYQTNNEYDSVYTTHSDDQGDTWTSRRALGLRGTQQEIANYGNIEKIVNDTLYSPMYANFSVDTAQAYYDVSYDNSITWVTHKVIMKGLFAGSFPTGGSINETWILKIRQGATVATTSLMAIIRSEKYLGFHYQWWTDNGGDLWNSIAVDEGAWFSEYNQTSGPNTFPVSAQIVYDSIIQVYLGFRGNNVTGLPSGLRVIEGPLDAYKDPSLFGKPRTIYSPLSIKAFQNDFGYPYPFKLNQRPYVGVYDISVKHKSGASLSNTKTRGFIMPVDGNNYLEMYDTTSTVAIPTGTETTVETPLTRVDSDLFFDGDSGKIYFKYDGWYTLKARVTFAASASGTYRNATLWMVDYGDETGTSPSPMAGKYMIASQNIIPSTNPRFNRVELSGQIYAYAGMELRLTVQHDVGSNLNILNSALDDRSTIQLKKSK